MTLVQSFTTGFGVNQPKETKEISNLNSNGEPRNMKQKDNYVPIRLPPSQMNFP